MIARLAAVTALIALFAVSFAGLVERARPVASAAAVSSGDCLERGLVCARGS